ncbi:MAG TPA: class I SAM-dependent methyltransferase [Vicinamibacterales bacterium]|nr:class I SAM-dependent methyltransferase [Vicinamibacterales bacterium]
MIEPDAQAKSEELIERLNTSWRVAPQQPASPSLKHRLAHRVRAIVARLLRPQETFNATLVQYVNTSVRPLEVAIDDVRRFHEALSARERRVEAAMAAMRAEHEELRMSVGVLQQATHTLSKEIARRAASVAPVEATTASAQTSPAVPRASDASRGVDALSHKYVGFEDAFRGSPDTIRARLVDYMPIFAGTADVLDIGCGRGEFLGLLREQGVSGRGIDLNDAMVDVCRDQGLEATKADALSYLQRLPDHSLGGLFAAQVVEHLEPAYLTHLLEAAFDKLRPGSPIVLETINPACWFAFFESYIRDITHVRPLHPDTLKFLLLASGFNQIDVRYRAPYPEHEKLQPIAKHDALGDSIETLNANVKKLNQLLFTYLDYAAVARRP